MIFPFIKNHNKFYFAWLHILLCSNQKTRCVYSAHSFLLEPLHFAKSVPCLIIGSVYQVGVLLGTSLQVQSCACWIDLDTWCSIFGTIQEASGELCCLFRTLGVIGTREYLSTQTWNIWKLCVRLRCSISRRCILTVHVRIFLTSSLFKNFLEWKCTSVCWYPWYTLW